MKKVAIIMLCAVSVFLAGCQNAELEDCKAENAKLKLEVKKLEKELGDSFKAMESLTKELSNMENK